MTLPIKRNTDLIEKFNEVVKVSKRSKPKASNVKTVKIMPNLPKKSKAQLKKQTDELAKKKIKINTPSSSSNKKITISANENKIENVELSKNLNKKKFIEEEKAFIFKNGIYNKTIFKDHYNNFSSKFNIYFTDAELFDIYNDLLKLSELSNNKFSSTDETFLTYKKLYTDLISDIKDFKDIYDYSSPSWNISISYDKSIVTAQRVITTKYDKLKSKYKIINNFPDHEKILKSLGLPVNINDIDKLIDDVKSITHIYNSYLADKNTINNIYDSFIKIDTSKICSYKAYQVLDNIFKTHDALITNIINDNFLNLKPVFNKYKIYMEQGEEILNLFIDAKTLYDQALHDFNTTYGAHLNFLDSFNKYDNVGFDKTKISDYATLKSEPEQRADRFVDYYKFIKSKFFKIDVDKLHDMPSDYPNYNLFNNLYSNKNNLDNNIKFAAANLKYITDLAHKCIDIIEYINIEWYDYYKFFLQPEFIDELNKILYTNILSKKHINVDDYKKILNDSGTKLRPEIKGPNFSSLKNNLIDHIYINEKADKYVIDTVNIYLKNMPLKNGVFSSINIKPYEYDDFITFKNHITSSNLFLPEYIFNRAIDSLSQYYDDLLNLKIGNDHFQFPPVYPNPFFNTTPTNKLFNNTYLSPYGNKAFEKKYSNAASKWDTVADSLIHKYSYFSSKRELYDVVKSAEANEYYLLPNTAADRSDQAFYPMLYILPYTPLYILYNKFNSILPPTLPPVPPGLVLPTLAGPATPATTPAGPATPATTPAGPATPATTPAGPATPATTPAAPAGPATPATTPATPATTPATPATTPATPATTPATGSGRTVIKLNYINYLPIPVNKKMRGGVKITVPLRTIINHDI